MLPIVAIVFQVFIALFLIVTAVVIKIIFKDKKRLKPKKRNMISFKAFNIIYSSIFFITIAPTLINVFFGFNIELLPFAIVVGHNAMLLSFLIMNEEAWIYFKIKLKKWQNMRENHQRIQNTIENQQTMWAENRRHKRPSDENDQNNDIFVIDIEN